MNAETQAKPKSTFTRRGRRRPTAVWIERMRCGDGTSYRIRWTDPLTGKIGGQSCGRDLALARIRRDQKKAELRDGLSGRLPGKTLTELKDHLSAFMAGKSVHTVRKTKDSLDGLIALCGERLLEHVDKGFIMDFRAKRLNAGVSVATVNKDVRQIRSALSYAADAGWIRFNPLLRWKNARLTEPERAVRVVEPAEFAKLIAPDACPNPTFRVLLIVAFHQGLRRSELANLRWAAVDLDGNGLHVVNNPEAGEYTKSRKNRTLPMHPVVYRELTALRADVPTVVKNGRAELKYPHVFTWPDGTAYRPDWITVEFTRVAKRAGVDCSIHDLRRSFSTLAQRAGVDRLTVKDLGGWSSVSVVEKHYTGEIRPALERAMQLISQAQAASA